MYVHRTDYEMTPQPGNCRVANVLFRGLKRSSGVEQACPEWATRSIYAETKTQWFVKHEHFALVFVLLLCDTIMSQSEIPKASYHYLGKSGLRVSVPIVSLGGWLFNF